MRSNSAPAGELPREGAVPRLGSSEMLMNVFSKGALTFPIKRESACACACGQGVNSGGEVVHKGWITHSGKWIPRSFTLTCLWVKEFLYVSLCESGYFLNIRVLVVVKSVPLSLV